MAYEIRDPGDSKNFEYPPVPSVYTNRGSTFGGLQGTAPMEHTELGQSSYPYYGHQATASFTKSPCALSYPVNVDKNALMQDAPVTSPALLLYHSPLAPLTVTGNDLSSRDAANTISTVRKRSRRGASNNFVCDECGYKFTAKASLRRHSTICRGKKPIRKQYRVQSKSIESKSEGLHSQSDTDALSVSEIQPSQQDKNEQDAGSNGTLGNISVTNMSIDSQGPSKASSTSNLTTLMSNNRRPLAPQPYVPQGPDTFAGHADFRCDLCPGIFARRDILQIHKAQVHGVTEFPFLPDSGTIDIPPYLKGVTLENSSKHSQHALRVFLGGALSSSPCQHCISRELDCIVNPFVSSKCSLCNYYDNGKYCGAAGVKYR